MIILYTDNESKGKDQEQEEIHRAVVVPIFWLVRGNRTQNECCS